MGQKIDTDWIRFLKETDNYDHYDGMCDCYQCRDIRTKEFEKWKEQDRLKQQTLATMDLQ